jgi:glutathione S-transferase
LNAPADIGAMTSEIMDGRTHSPKANFSSRQIITLQCRVHPSPDILVTIPFSHFCEKARWALDRTGLPYREEPHAPMLARLAASRGHRGTVPVLVHGHERLVDSTEILVHADAMRGGGLLYPRDAALRREVDSLVESFDSELGLHVRRWVYSLLLPDAKLIRALWSRGVPRVEAMLVPVIAPVGRVLARKAYDITPDSALRSLEQVRDVFRHIDLRLSDGRRFLTGSRFTAADLTFAALAAPVLLPAGCRAVQPSLEETPDAMREEVLRLRNSAAGEFVLRLFAEERNRPADPC